MEAEDRKGRYYPPPEGRQCSATSKQSGERCRKAAIAGGTVCKTHGGGAPQTVRKARLRLAELVDPSIAVLGSIMADKAASPQARLRAVENVLDRAGIPRAADQTVVVEDAREMLRERLRALADEKREASEDGAREL